MSDAEVVTYEQKVECLCKIYGWIYGVSQTVIPFRSSFSGLSWLLDRECDHDTLQLSMAAVMLKQYDMVVVLENDDYVWIGDYNEIKEQIQTVIAGNYIKKVY